MVFDYSDFFLHDRQRQEFMRSFCFILWTTVEMQKMMMMASSTFDLNHTLKAQMIFQACKALNLLDVTQRKTTVMLERDF